MYGRGGVWCNSVPDEILLVNTCFQLSNRRYDILAFIFPSFRVSISGFLGFLRLVLWLELVFWKGKKLVFAMKFVDKFTSCQFGS